MSLTPTTTQLKGKVELADGTSAVLTIKKPLTIGYTPSFVSGQIGYSQTFASPGGNVVSGTNNIYRITTSSTALVGVYQVNVAGFVYNSGGNFVGTTFFNLETGYYGGDILARNYTNASGATGLSFDNYQQSVSAVYSSFGTLDLYGAIQITYGSATGGTTPIWGLTIIATRIA